VKWGEWSRCGGTMWFSLTIPVCGLLVWLSSCLRLVRLLLPNTPHSLIASRDLLQHVVVSCRAYTRKDHPSSDGKEIPCFDSRTHYCLSTLSLCFCLVRHVDFHVSCRDRLSTARSSQPRCGVHEGIIGMMTAGRAMTTSPRIDQQTVCAP
jgi:hypothetical protein